MPKQITNAELKKLNITRKMWDSWYTIMTCLYNFWKTKLPDQTSQAANIIYIDQFSIYCEFINCKHVDVIIRITEPDESIFRMRYRGHLFSVFNNVKNVLFFELKLKDHGNN